jgi:hypothetical protein
MKSTRNADTFLHKTDIFASFWSVLSADRSDPPHKRVCRPIDGKSAALGYIFLLLLAKKRRVL